MNRYRMMTAGLLMAGMLATGAAYAQEPRGGGLGGPGGRAGRFAPRGMPAGLPLRSLDLTQAQQDLIRDIQQRHREEARQALKDLRDAHDAQRKAVDALPLDEGAIRATAQRVAEAQAEVALHEARVRSEVMAALTPDQQQQLRTLIAERQMRMEQRRAELEARRQQLRQNAR